jgi:hypothetical protein
VQPAKLVVAPAEVGGGAPMLRVMGAILLLAAAELLLAAAELLLAPVKLLEAAAELALEAVAPARASAARMQRWRVAGAAAESLIEQVLQGAQPVLRAHPAVRYG